MQKILRINLRARNQALKQARKEQLANRKDEWNQHRQRQIEIDGVEASYVRNERKHRREDWIAGPLAPKRDAGTKRHTFATVRTIVPQGAPFPTHVRRGPRGNGWDRMGSEGPDTDPKEWEGVGNEGNIVAGDRVCVVQGRPDVLGKIGIVKEVSAENKSVTVTGINMADVEIPEGTPGGENRRYQSIELPLSIHSVRLVHRLRGEASSGDRDVIVRHVRGGAPYYQREFNSPLPRHTRYILGDDIEIPWPEVDVPQYQAYPGDTSRLYVEQQTYTPSIHDPPLPTAAILEELRRVNYKRDREWHEEEYVRRKTLEDARAQWYMQRKMQSPLDQLAEQQGRGAQETAKQARLAGVSAETAELLLDTIARRQPSAQKA